MNHIYSFEILEFRRLLAECCQNIFRDNAMAEMFFRRVCDCCENFLDDNIYDPWISCDVKNPDEAGWYIVTTDDGVLLRWYSTIHGWECSDAIAWTPLPRPYNGEEYEC